MGVGGGCGVESRGAAQGRQGDKLGSDEVSPGLFEGLDCLQG